jgi:TPR repeat protein
MKFIFELPIFRPLIQKMQIPSTLASQAVAEPAPWEQEQIAQAAQAFESQEYAKAIALLLPLVQYPAAQCFLGMAYLDDPLQQSMRSKGWKSLIASAHAGFGYAWLTLGHRYLTGHDRGSQIEVKETQDSVEQARYWLSKGAELGCAYSQYFLSQCDCKDGNFVTAAKWLYLAATLGHEGASELCDSNALDLDSESLAIAQKQAIQWLSAKAAISDEWALRIATIRAADKNSTGRGKGNSGTVLVH